MIMNDLLNKLFHKWLLFCIDKKMKEICNSKVIKKKKEKKKEKENKIILLILISLITVLLIYYCTSEVN